MSKSTKYLFFSSIVTIIAIFGPYIYFSMNMNSLEKVLYDRYNMHILSPPNDGYKLGTIYAIDFFGNVADTICSIDNNISLPPPKETQGIESQDELSIISNTQTLFHGGREISGKISISLSRPLLYEHDNVDAERFFILLTNDNHCRREVRQNLELGRCLTQIRSLLEATIKMNTSTVDSADLEIKNKLKEEFLLKNKDELDVTTNSISIENFFEKRLFYGYKASYECHGLETDAVLDERIVMRTPNKRWWHIIAMRNGLMIAWSWIKYQSKNLYNVVIG